MLILISGGSLWRKVEMFDLWIDLFMIQSAEHSARAAKPAMNTYASLPVIGSGANNTFGGPKSRLHGGSGVILGIIADIRTQKRSGSLR